MCVCVCVCVREREREREWVVLQVARNRGEPLPPLPTPSTVSLDTQCGQPRVSQRPFRSVRKLNPELKTVESSSHVILGQLLNL